MRKVEVYKVQRNPNWSNDQSLKNKYERVLDFTGLFHCFSTDYDEFNDGPAMKPVAIVELSDGSVEIVNAGLIRFIDPAPVDKTENEIKTAVSGTKEDKMNEKVLEALSQGAWGNYMTIHFLEWLSGERVISAPKDIGIEISELPRLLEQAKYYESNCIAIRNEHLITAST